jgi:hypothetical protein
VQDTYCIVSYSDLTPTNITVGIVFINKIDKFSPCRLGHFEAWEVFWLGHLGVGTFWGLGRFGAWNVQRVGTF